VIGGSMNSSSWLRTFVRGSVNACGTGSPWNAGGKENPFVKNGAFVAGSLSIAPGSGLKTDGGCVGFAELVAHLNCKRAFGTTRFVEPGGTPASGLNSVGGNGGLLVLMI
jgi:hypothetical protein